MTKNDLINTVADMYDMKKTDVKNILNGIVDTIKDGLEEGEKIDIHEFGSFSTSTRAARKGRNPQTGEDLEIPEMKVVKFKPAKALKDAVRYS